MKTFSGPKNHDATTAQGCFATNLVMPGLGSLAGGRKTVGIAQLALCGAGFTLTLATGIKFIFWALAHWSEFHDPNPAADPMQPLRDLWQHARWPVLGMLLFGLAWFWALFTSRSLLAEAKLKNANG
jgi:hypothetical protein